MSEYKDLCKWLRDHSSGGYRKSAEGAEVIEILEAERDSLQAAKKACIDIYMDLHVSEMKGKPEHLKQAWSVGNILYIKKLEGQG